MDASRGCRSFQQARRHSRRSLIQAGGLSALGLSMSDWLLARSHASSLGASGGFGRAKRCIFIFLWGGPSHLDTLDPKPEAPDEIRGHFRTIATRLPGVRFSEILPRMAQVNDQFALIRSMSHGDPAHLSSGHATLTGHWAPVVKSDDVPPGPKDSPHLGALVSALRPGATDMPSWVSLPWKAYHPAAPGGQAPGQHGGWLGSSHDGMLLTGDPSQPQWKPPGISLPDTLSLDRLQSRAQLHQLLSSAQRSLDQQAASQSSLQNHQQQALAILGSSRAREAFDLSRESEATRDRYGRNIHGQSVLLARRLIEHEVPLVSVNWHNDGKNFWDTHGDNFNRLKTELAPPADLAFTALLSDLKERGMLEDTLVAWVGEFGRRPQITAANAGREHWPYCYSGILAGGPVRGGVVHGASDRHGAYPKEHPVSPLDFATTMLHALGIEPTQTLYDREGRPHFAGGGKLVESIF
jgi:uncharacterized protein (DUF1501 family)